MDYISKEIENKYELFADYPDVVSFEDMRAMLGGLGKKTSYKLLKNGTIYGKKVRKKLESIKT